MAGRMPGQMNVLLAEALCGVVAGQGQELFGYFFFQWSFFFEGFAFFLLVMIGGMLSDALQNGSLYLTATSERYCNIPKKFFFFEGTSSTIYLHIYELGFSLAMELLCSNKFPKVILFINVVHWGCSSFCKYHTAIFLGSNFAFETTKQNAVVGRPEYHMNGSWRWTKCCLAWRVG